MSQAFKVFVVDDDPVVLGIMSAILEPDCEIHTFATAEDCQARMTAEPPDCFLLDVKLPGMDGYRLCRLIKDTPALRNTPTIFVSAHDTIEERIKGYDAGGQDFIVKPFEPEELLRKVLIAQNTVQQQRSLAVQAEEAELLSSLVMASMDETGILLQFMSKLIAMESAEETALGLLELMRRYRLEGVVQTRVGKKVETLSAAGRNLPLEVSVIEHVRDQGRIFEFRRRSVHNFERVTLMVNNLPLEDPDFCGRLRDHLSVAVQGVDSRLKAIETEQLNQRNQAAIRSALASISNSIVDLRAMHQRDNADSNGLVVELQETLINSFYRLGLTDEQEKFLQNMVGDFLARMIDVLNRGTEAQETLQRLNDKLGQLRNA